MAMVPPNIYSTKDYYFTTRATIWVLTQKLMCFKEKKATNFSAWFSDL